MLADDLSVQQEREQHGEHDQRAGREHQHEQVLLVGEAEAAAAFTLGLGAPCERPGGERVEQRVGHGHEERRLQHLLPGLAEHLGQRGLDDFLLLLGHAEDRGLLHVDSHDEADDHQHGGQQERHTPTPGTHRIGVIERLQHEVGAVRQEEADRGAELREGAVQRTLVFGRVLGGDQRSTGPFAAKADALDETQQT